MDIDKKKKALDLVVSFAEHVFSQAYNEDTYRLVIVLPKAAPEDSVEELKAAMCGSNMGDSRLVACLRFFADAIEERALAEEESKTAVAH